MNTAPVTQKVKIIVPSILPQFEATSVHHQGVQKWKAIEPMITKAKAIDTARRGKATAIIIPATTNTKIKAIATIIIYILLLKK